MDDNKALQTEGPGSAQDRPTASQPGRIEPRLITRDEAANYLQLSTDTLDRLRRERKVAFYRIGRSSRFGPWHLFQLASGKSMAAKELLENMDRVLTKAQFADFLSVSTRTIENLTRDRRLWHRKTGGMMRFHLGEALIQLDNEFRVAAVE